MVSSLLSLISQLLLIKNHQAPSVAIFYGSDTETCERLADMLATTAPLRGLEASVRPLVWDETRANIPKDQPVVFITSIMCEGEAADNGVQVLTSIETEKCTSLDGVHFVVFGSGSSKTGQLPFSRTGNIILNFHHCGLERLNLLWSIPNPEPHAWSSFEFLSQSESRGHVEMFDTAGLNMIQPTR